MAKGIDWFDGVDMKGLFKGLGSLVVLGVGLSIFESIFRK